VLSRLAGAFTTLGLFTLPFLAGTLALSPWRRLARWQRWLALSMALALVLGFVIRVATFGQRVLFPHVSNILTRRGFFVFGYSGSPESLVIPDWALGIVTLGTLAGAILLVVALVATLPTPALRGPAVVPLLFGFIA